MEIYRGTVPTIEFPHPVADTSITQVTWSINDGAETYAIPEIGTDKTTVNLGYLQFDGEVKVNWSFTLPGTDEYTETHVYHVVTPILPITDVKKILETDSDEDAMVVEQATRHIIQAHCGQSFGKYVGAKSVTGSGEANLRLPARLVKLNTINGNYYLNNTVAVRGGGWFLMSKNMGIPTIRADFDGWHESPWMSRVPIIPPHAKQYYSFAEHEEYTIDGVWGWESVPPSVREAAKLLVNDYGCNDSQYRDRFLSSITAADWRIQFHDGAFSNTGNVRANQLLAEFVLRRGWVVV